MEPSQAAVRGPGNSVRRAIRTLRATRVYAGRAIPREILSEVLEAGRWTGSGKNRQPWRFVAVTDAPTIKMLSETGALSSHVAGAAAVIAIVSDKGIPAGFAGFDLGRCCQSMLLAAHELGLGSCVVWLNADKLRTVLAIPEDYGCSMAIALGYPGDGPDDQISGHPKSEILFEFGRKPLGELVHWERWTAEQPSPRG